MGTKGRSDRRDKGLLGPSIVVVLAISIFGVLAASVEPGPIGVDASILQNFESVRSLPQDRVMVAITSVGAGLPVFLLTVLVALGVLLRGHWREASFLVLAGIGTEVLTIFSKLAFARPRPPMDVVSQLTPTGGFSFPSGHALGAMVLYTSLAMVAVAIGSQPLKRATIAFAIFFVPTMGITRLYLGVHYPSDVVGGWALGAAWVWALYVGYLSTTRPRNVRSDL